MVIRFLLFASGIILVSLGIVLCVDCNLGISPISSIPYVLSTVVPLSIGTLTMIFHFINTGIQMILLRRVRDIRLWLQLPIAFIFGVVIDCMKAGIIFNNTVLINQVLALVFSVVFTALGMVCMTEINLVQNPPDGTVRTISLKSGMELGTVKILYDVSCVFISLAISLTFMHRIYGFGIATIVSAIFVGKTVTGIRHMLSSKTKTIRREN